MMRGLSPWHLLASSNSKCTNSTVLLPYPFMFVMPNNVTGFAPASAFEGEAFRDNAS